MKISSLILLLSLLIYKGDSNIQKNEERFELNTEKSFVKWSLKDQNEVYSGTMKLKSGYVVMKEDDLKQVVVFVNTQSIFCEKCGENKSAQKIIEFVKSPEFLNSTAMDYAVFKMYSHEKIEKSKEDQFLVEGDLTIKGYSNKVNFPTTIKRKKNEILAEGTFTMNRSLWKLDNPKLSEDEIYTMALSLCQHMHSISYLISRIF